jgi:hypothetical protein
MDYDNHYMSILDLIMYYPQILHKEFNEELSSEELEFINE